MYIDRTQAIHLHNMNRAARDYIGYNSLNYDRSGYTIRNHIDSLFNMFLSLECNFRIPEGSDCFKVRKILHEKMVAIADSPTNPIIYRFAKIEDGTYAFVDGYPAILAQAGFSLEKCERCSKSEFYLVWTSHIKCEQFCVGCWYEDSASNEISRMRKPLDKQVDNI